MTLTFRNIDASPDDPVDTWPYEGLVIAIEEGLISDWQPIFAELRNRPWGPVSRRIERYVSYAPKRGATRLFASAVERARARAEDAERQKVAGQVRGAVARSGLTSAAFAEHIGTSASRLSTYATGKVAPSATMLLRISQAADDLARHRDAGEGQPTRALSESSR